MIGGASLVRYGIMPNYIDYPKAMDFFKRKKCYREYVAPSDNLKKIYDQKMTDMLKNGAYQGGTPNSGQFQFTKFSVGVHFHRKNFLSSLFELIWINIVNWNKLKFENFISDHFHNCEHFVKNYGYRTKSNLYLKF
jgi:hypothetical protein